MQMGASMETRTVEGLMLYTDWLKDKGYQGGSATESWKSATKVVFETVEPDGWGAISLEGLDLDDYIRRFQTLAGAKYRAETITVYRRRIQNAIEAQAYYVEHGKPPSFKRGNPRSENGSAAGDGQKPATKTKAKAGKVDTAPADTQQEQHGDLVAFPFPLRNGQMARLHLPARGLHPKDADRMSAFLRSLQMDEQPQIPERTGSGEEELAA
jgi:hypothetical protein